VEEKADGIVPVSDDSQSFDGQPQIEYDDFKNIAAMIS
jgi:hypothetical protein